MNDRMRQFRDSMDVIHNLNTDYARKTWNHLYSLWYPYWCLGEQGPQPTELSARTAQELVSRHLG